jgi:hypothetical protein
VERRYTERCREGACLAGIVAPAAALRFYWLRRESIWIDEAYSIRLASVPSAGSSPLPASTGTRRSTSSCCTDRRLPVLRAGPPPP